MGKRLSGIVSGAIAGFAYGGPWGAVAGAVVGGVAGDQAERAEEKREAAQKRAVEDARRGRAIANASQELERSRQIRQTIAQRRAIQAVAIQRGAGGGAPVGFGQSVAGDTASALGSANTQRAAAVGVASAQDSYSANMMTASSSNKYDVNASIVQSLGQAGGFAYQQGWFSGFFNNDAAAQSFANESAGAVSGGR